MNKFYYLALILFFLLLFQIGFLDRFTLNYNLSIVVPVLFIIAFRDKIEISLLYAILTGFFLDIMSLERFPFWSIFLMLMALFVSFTQKKFFDYNHNLIAILGLFIICLVRILFQFLIYGENLFSFIFILNIAYNFLLCLVIYESWILLKSRWKFFEIDEKGSKEL